MIKTNKKGMTLVELLVYIVLAGMLLAPVIMLVQNSSVNMARDASNVSLRMSGREILNIIYDDLKNTGYKLYPTGANIFKANDSVSYMDTAKFRLYVVCCASTPNGCAAYGPCPPRLGSRLGDGLDSITGIFDVSSFMPGNKVGGNNYYDSLTVRMGRLSSSGVWEGIDTITYKVNAGKELIRTIKGISSPAGKTVTLARNVEALKFRYSVNLVDWDDTFNQTPASLIDKGSVEYVKVIMVTRDPKKLAPTNPASPVKLIDADGTNPPLVLTPTDASLYERHEIVIPIPNNGLFP